MIDDDKTNYDWNSGYASIWLNTPMTITLDNIYTIDTINVKVWDLDGRHYQYTIETSTDNSNWISVDTSGDRSGLETHSFSPRDVRYIRITGTYNSAGNGIFHVVELEAYTA